MILDKLLKESGAHSIFLISPEGEIQTSASADSESFDKEALDTISKFGALMVKIGHDFFKRVINTDAPSNMYMNNVNLFLYVKPYESNYLCFLSLETLNIKIIDFLINNTK